MGRSSREGGPTVSQEGAEVQGGADAVRQELEQLREWMAVIKQEAAAEVDRKWDRRFEPKRYSTSR
jgi:hypothetical protein